MSCLPCEEKEKALAKQQELINQAIEYARNDAATTGNREYKVVRLVNGGISWKRQDEPTNLEVVEYLLFDK